MSYLLALPQAYTTTCTLLTQICWKVLIERQLEGFGSLGTEEAGESCGRIGFAFTGSS